MKCVLLSTLAVALGASSVVGSSCPAESSEEHLGLVQRKASRLIGDDTKEAVFRILDSDSDHHLNQKELLVAAKQLGVFKGSTGEWPEAYKSLREENGFPEAGVDLATFDKLLKDSDGDSAWTKLVGKYADHPKLLAWRLGQKNDPANSDDAAGEDDSGDTDGSDAVEQKPEMLNHGSHRHTHKKHKHNHKEHDMHKDIVEGGGEPGEELTDSSCPAQQKPKLLYNHISKTGGTPISMLLKKVVPRDDFKVDEDGDIAAQLTPEDKQNYFVIGVVRRPCDFLVSNYYETKGHENFTKFVENRLKGTTDKADPRVGHTWLMSKAIEMRYGAGSNVHCMIRTHSLKADFIGCMRKFKACGGTLTTDESLEHLALDHLVDETLQKSIDHAHKEGRSVGDHPACTELFGKELLSKVVEKEQSVISEFDLGSCCSSDPKE